MKLNKKYLWNILLILGITSIALYFSLKDNYTQIIDAIGKMNPMLLVLVLCWGMLYIAVWGVGFQVLGQSYKKKYSLHSGILVAFIGNFFAGITPSSTGGQIGQVFVLKKQGIKPSDGASLLWADFILYQTAMMIYATVLFILKFKYYASQSAWFWIVFLGYLVNLVVIIGLYTIAIFPQFYIKACQWAVRFLTRFNMFKDPEKIMNTWTEQMTNFTSQSRELAHNKDAIIKVLIINFIRLTLYYALPYVIAKGLGIAIGPSKLADVLALSAFVTMANCFIPLPGAAGGTEVIFTLLFGSIFGKLTGADMLLWRISSYYIPMVVGAGCFMVFQNHENRKEIKRKAREADELAAENDQLKKALEQAESHTRTLEQEVQKEEAALKADHSEKENGMDSSKKQESDPVKENRPPEQADQPAQPTQKDQEKTKMEESSSTKDQTPAAEPSAQKDAESEKSGASKQEE